MPTRTVALLLFMWAWVAYADVADPLPIPDETGADRTLLADFLDLQREATAIPFILDELALSPDRRRVEEIRLRRDEIRGRLEAFEEALGERLGDEAGVRRFAAFLAGVDEPDLPAFRGLGEGLARLADRLPEPAAAEIRRATARVREARAKSLRRENLAVYVAAVRKSLSVREPYAGLPGPRPAAAPSRPIRSAAYVPPVFEPQWTDPVKHWGGAETKGPGGPAAHKFLMEELVSDKGRAYYEKISGQTVHYPTREEIIAFIRGEVARQTPPEILAEGGIGLIRLQDVAVGLSRCESVISQFTGKGGRLLGQPWEFRPVVYAGNDASQSWANVVGCMQISTYWWCRSLEEGVHLAWDWRYNVTKGVAEMVKYLRQFKGATGDELLHKMCDRYSRRDWDLMQRFLAEPERHLR